ncbi:auxin-responsive protein IAA14-like [Impatiens glandulifera]|uniref:auxin-responsive protein IAA14-like n=1 Tax=Impatiens glandulifera TaxID=253017 RepID=UPI001FB0D356|nr:auxin-responsive protein IAA14-like [Impatiens glandulifera]
MSGGGGGDERGSYRLETELCLGLPGAEMKLVTSTTAAASGGGKRGFSENESETSHVDLKLKIETNHNNIDDQSADHKKLLASSTSSCSKQQQQQQQQDDHGHNHSPSSKAQVVGWPPVRSHRKNVMTQKIKNKKKVEYLEDEEKMSTTSGSASGCCSNNKVALVAVAAAALVKVSMDGAPYLRKVDLRMYGDYQQLSNALANMFSSFIGGGGSEGRMINNNNNNKIDLYNYVHTYEDKDGDWMLVGDVPWEMFVHSCRRLRIITKGKGKEGLNCT